LNRYWRPSAVRRAEIGIKRRLALVAAAIVALAALSGGQASAQGELLPWGQSSDMVAWQTLSQLMAPAGNPTTHTVEFETWASDKDVYQSATPHWPLPGTPKQLQMSALGSFEAISDLHAAPRPDVISPNTCGKPANGNPGNFPPGACIGEEVRRNFASFQYIVSNGLYSQAGLAQAFKNGLKVDLPADAVEFKGDWVRVTDLIAWLKRSEGLTVTAAQVRNNYYTNFALDGNVRTEFALVSFHFSTKQIKDWVWADFEHKWNPGRCDTIGCHDDFGATEPDIAPKATANRNYGACAKTAKVLAMLNNAGINPVWQNYCLKGSEITFLQKNGKPSLLGDSVIERMNANNPVARSSCITCHAYASFDKNGNFGLIFFTAKAPQPIGNVDKAKLKGYSQNDFLWGIVKIPPK
jgi:hypothetical protein